MNPESPSLDQAMEHYRAGRPQVAEEICRRILSNRPDDADALQLLGIMALGAGRPEIARDHLQSAIRHHKQPPALADTHHNLGMAYAAMQRWDEAAAAFRQSLEFRPDSAGAWQSLANVYRQLGDTDAAIAAFDRVIALRPDWSAGYHGLGQTLTDLGRSAEAVDSLRKAAALEPGNPFILSNLAIALVDRGQFDEACELYTTAIRLKPDLYPARTNYAVALAARGQGDLGWNIFFNAYDLKDPLIAKFPDRRWAGQDPAGKTILVYSPDQFGDAILLARFVPLLEQRGAKVILQCRRELAALFESLGIHQVSTREQPAPDFDYCVYQWSLPIRLGCTMETSPRRTPYLSPPPQRVRKWSGRVPSDGKKNIGLVWAASESHLRSRSLKIFEPLKSIPGIRFVSLQKGPESRQQPPEGMDLIDLTSQIDDFADTAALIQQLDLVISVDTSPAHLAGALGKPVWVLIPFHTHFLWMRDPSDSHWYPTMRLFRQKDPRNWDHPIAAITDALRQFQP